MADVFSWLFVRLNWRCYFALDFQGAGKPNHGVYDNNGCFAYILQYHQTGGKQGYDYGHGNCNLKRA